MMHGPTFMANPLACAIANESIDILAENDMEARIAHLNEVISKGLEPARGFSNVEDVRSIGAIGVVEMKEPVNVGEFQKECVKRGIWVRPFGKNVYIMPPYIISDDDLNYLITNMLEIVKPKA